MLLVAAAKAHLVRVAPRRSTYVYIHVQKPKAEAAAFFLVDGSLLIFREKNIEVFRCVARRSKQTLRTRKGGVRGGWGDP